MFPLTGLYSSETALTDSISPNCTNCVTSFPASGSSINTISDSLLYDKEKLKINSSNRSFNLLKKKSHPNFYFSSIA